MDRVVDLIYFCYWVIMSATVAFIIGYGIIILMEKI